MSDPMRVPAPGEVDPVYSGKRGESIRRWLDEMPHESMLGIQFPPADPVACGSDLTTKMITFPAPVIMTRHMCRGHAPYVGAPFFYEWWVGVDDLGRMVAGEARRVMRFPHGQPG